MSRKSQPSPLLVRRSDYVRAKMNKFIDEERRKPSPPALPPNWPPAGWENDDMPFNDNEGAIREWFDTLIESMQLNADHQRDSGRPDPFAAQPTFESERGKPDPHPGSQAVRDGYRLAYHLAKAGTAPGNIGEEPNGTYNYHDAAVILRRLRQRLWPVPGPPQAGVTTNGESADETYRHLGHTYIFNNNGGNMTNIHGHMIGSAIGDGNMLETGNVALYEQDVKQSGVPPELAAALIAGLKGIRESSLSEALKQEALADHAKLTNELKKPEAERQPTLLKKFWNGLWSVADKIPAVVKLYEALQKHISGLK